MKLNWKEDFLNKVRELKNKGFTWNQIKNKLKTKLSTNALRKGFYRYIDGSTPVEKTLPKILLIDIETLPMEVYAWQLGDQNIGLDMMIKDWSILSFSSKWLGDSEKSIMYMDTRNEKDIRDDRKLLKAIHKLLSEASVVIGQNSDRFDIPKLFARFVKHKMTPPSSFRSIDTYKIAKRKFNFTSNKLAYMTSHLCEKYVKSDHSEFAGIKLWTECLKRNPKAFAAMEKYNKYDVLSLEELYFKLAPWDNTIDFSVYTDAHELVCSCGHTKFEKNGFHYTNTGKFQRFQCKKCGKEHRAKINLFSKEKIKSLKSRE